MIRVFHQWRLLWALLVSSLIIAVAYLIFYYGLLIAELFQTNESLSDRHILFSYLIGGYLTTRALVLAVSIYLVCDFYLLKMPLAFVITNQNEGVHE